MTREHQVTSSEIHKSGDWFFLDFPLSNQSPIFHTMVSGACSLLTDWFEWGILVISYVSQSDMREKIMLN